MKPNASNGPTPEATTATLLDLGSSLPIGVPTGVPPVLEKGFSFKPFRMKEEREIDKIRNRKGGAGNHPGKVVEDVLAHMLTSWGGDTEFAEKSEKHRRAAVRSAFMADVLYAYVMLRVEAMGPVLGFNIECPHCAHEWAWKTNLEGLEVEFVEHIDRIDAKVYKLRHGIKFGERVYDVLQVAPPTWSAVSDIQQGRTRGGTGDIKARMILSCIRQAGVEAEPKAPPISAGNALLDQMSKRDVEELAQYINDAFPNVDLSLEISCPNCSGEFAHSVQWNWDFFFSGSSLPGRSMR